MAQSAIRLMSGSSARTKLKSLSETVNQTCELNFRPSFLKFYHFFAKKTAFSRFLAFFFSYLKLIFSGIEPHFFLDFIYIL